MKKGNMLLVMVFLNLCRYWWLSVMSVILIVAGALWWDVCLYVGLSLLAVTLIIAAAGALRTQIIMRSLTEANPEFNEMMEKLSADPNAFMADVIEGNKEHLQLHGEALLALSDDELFDTVCFQNVELTQDAEDTEEELSLLTGARKTVYILSLFNMEIQNGGICQFFVNSSRATAPYVLDSLKIIGADEHSTLFEGFIKENGIDVFDLDSFKVSSKRGYIKQTRRFNFDSFDDKYYTLPDLKEKTVAFIKNNIMEF